MSKIYFILLVLIAVSVPAGLTLVAHAFVLMLIIWWFATGYFKTYSSQLKLPQVWLPALIYLLVVIGFFFANNSHKAISTLSVYIPYLFPVFLIPGPSLSETQRNNILKGFILALCIALAASDIYAVVDILNTGEKYILLKSGVVTHKLSGFGLARLLNNWHPTYISLFGVWAIAFILNSKFYYKKFLLGKPGNTIVLLFLFMNIVLLNSVATLIALFVITLVWIKQLLLPRKPAVAVLVILILVAAVPFFYIVNPFHNNKLATLKATKFRITDKEEERNFLTIRLAKWVSHVEIFKKYPITGTTPGDIQDERKKVYKEKGFNELLTHNYNAHNQYLEMLCRFGVIGFAIFLSFLLIPFFSKNRSIYYLPFILTISIVFLTESFLENQLGLMSFFFFYSLLNKPVTSS